MVFHIKGFNNKNLINQVVTPEQRREAFKVMADFRQAAK